MPTHDQSDKNLHQRGPGAMRPLSYMETRYPTLNVCGYTSEKENSWFCLSGVQTYRSVAVLHISVQEVVVQEHVLIQHIMTALPHD